MAIDPTTAGPPLGELQVHLSRWFELVDGHATLRIQLAAVARQIDDERYAHTVAALEVDYAQQTEKTLP